MFALVDCVLAHIDRYAMFSIGQRVGVAVSGGADSMCLVHLLHELAPRWNLHLSAVHIEHGIRGQASRDDAEFVRRAAETLGLPFHFHKAEVPAMAGNLEQAARETRHGFYRSLIGSGQVELIATGHTCSDQAETVMYRLLRGAGLAGLSGIRPVTHSGIVRPLLSIWRPEIEDWLRERGFVWCEDLTNQDLTFMRNRLRYETLPMLRAVFNPNLDQTLARMASVAQDEEIFWSQTADTYSDGEGPARGGAIILMAAPLAEGPVALARRRLRRAFERVKGDLRQIEFAHTEAVLEMARAGPGHSRVLLPGLDVIRSFEWIRIAPSGADAAIARDFGIPATIPGRASLPDGGTMTFELIEQEGLPQSYDRVENELDWQRLKGVGAANYCQVELRNWRPGDRYLSAGQHHEEKIKTLFQTGRVPLWDRRHWPVVTANGKIVWTRRFGPAAEVAAEPGRYPVLRIRESLCSA